MGFLSGIIGKIASKLFGGLFGGSGGTACPVIPIIPVPHKFWTKENRNAAAHKCPMCLKGMVAKRIEGSPKTQWYKCTNCNGTGEDPKNPAPKPPDGLSPRQQKKWRKKNMPEVAPWLKSKRFAKVPTETCQRGCGAKNPAWHDDMVITEGDEDKGGFWGFLEWLVDTFGDDS